jgi:hypothetical protein
MNIQEIRRANLRIWFSERTVPANEKSYVSQLLGGFSFGERAARRLEKTYGMDANYLDRPPAVEGDVAETAVSSQRSTEARDLIQLIGELDRKGGPAKQIFRHITGLLLVSYDRTSEQTPQNGAGASDVTELNKKASSRVSTAGLESGKRRPKSSQGNGR